MRHIPLFLAALLASAPMLAQTMSEESTVQTPATSAEAAAPVVIDDDIMFYIAPVAGKGLDAELCRSLDSKIRQGIARSKAASENPDELFEVRPEFFISDSGETEGMVMNVAKAKGELVLNLVSRIDGGVFNTLSIPLTGTAAGGTPAAVKAMAGSLKPSAPAFVRFVRTSRQRVKDYYAAHPDKLKLPLRPRATEPEPEVAQTPAAQPAPAAAPVAASEPQPEATPVVAAPAPAQTAPEGPLGDLYLSSPDKMRFEIMACEGSKVSRSINLTAKITNLDPDIIKYYVAFHSAILSDGKEKTPQFLRVNDSYPDTFTTPDNVPVTITFSIKGVDSSCDKVAFTDFQIGQDKAQVRNIPVTWK